MWKNQLYQCFGWALVGGGACVAGYLAYKYDFFGKGSFLAGKDNLKPIDDMEVKLPKPSEKVPEPQEQTQANATIPTADSLTEGNVANDNVPLVNTQSVVTSQPTSNAENQQFFYKFTATASSPIPTDLQSNNSKFALEVCDDNDDDVCEVKIEELKIYDFSSNDFSTKTLLNQTTNFVDNNVYLFERKTEIENDWLNKKLKITFSSETVTTIEKNGLQKFNSQSK